MKRLFSILFTAMLVFGSFAAWSQVTPTMLNESHFYRSREVMNGAYGNHCGYNEATAITRCRAFRVETTVNTQWQQDETRVWLEQSVWGPDQGGWRYVSCPIASSALQVKTKSTQVDVTFDTQGSGCWGYGYRYYFTCDPEEPYECNWEWVDWSYFGTATLQAQLSSPGYESDYKESRDESYKNNMTGSTGSSRWNCSGGDGSHVMDGGFTMYGDAIFGNVWHAFGTDESNGSFSYRKCSRMGKEKTKN